ncbi:MAG: hypothetical protein ACREPN_04100, partial [Rudaea sp.]
NLEPMPAAVTTQWSKHMQEYLPVLATNYERMLDTLASTKTSPDDARFIKIARVLVNELKTHANWDKLRAIGFKPAARVVFYGVGLAPVLRVELGDAAAFKAEVARIEQQTGEKLTVAKTGNQEYWQVGSDKAMAIVAVEGSHLVVTFAPANANDTLKQTLLGMTRPAQSLADAGTLQALARQYGYSPYGEGFVDFTRLAARLSNPLAGSDLEIAKAFGVPTSGIDAQCKNEYAALAEKFPRWVMGAQELTPRRVRIDAQMELEPALAKQLAAAMTAAPGTGAAGEGIVDISVAVPLLKLKDFWIAQADAVAAKPFACAQLTELNASFAQMKAKLDITVPPPFSDLTGLRFVLDKAEPRTGSMPDFAGRLLYGSSNPAAALAMAQLTVPGLKDLKVAADSKPVALPLPPGMLPANAPPLFVAMSDKAIAVGAGTGEDAKLGAFLAAPAATEPEFLRVHFSGAMYGLLGRFTQQVSAKLPPDKAAQIANQSQLFNIYEKWIRSADITFTANASGIALQETVEQN